MAEMHSGSKSSLTVSLAAGATITDQLGLAIGHKVNESFVAEQHLQATCQLVRIKVQLQDPAPLIQ